MTIKIEILSGLHRKAPAAILMTTPSQRILLDAGSGLECDEMPWPLPPNLDAVLISHDHVDHIGGLERLPANTPVYCTAVTAQSLPSHLAIKTVPVKGQFSLGEWTITTGSSGHAYGGIWFHIDLPGGFFYSGDISLESTFFRFDMPPAAQLALVDASYGLYDIPLHQQQDELVAHLAQRPVLCPVPPSGRAAEMVLLATSQGLTNIALDDPCHAALMQMSQHNDGTLIPERQADLRAILGKLPLFLPTLPLILAASPDGDTGMAGELRAQPHFSHRTVFTGHMSTRAQQLWQNGDLDFFRWNVHPTRQGLQQLIAHLACQRLVPLFTPIHDVPLWQRTLGCPLEMHPAIELTI